MRLGYLLILMCHKGVVRTRSGRSFRIDGGVYVYVGSCGNYCHARVTRHLLMLGRAFWHVDHLRGICKPIAVVVTGLSEDELARALTSKYPVVESFGNSDKPRDRSHLVRVNDGLPRGLGDLLVIVDSLSRVLHRVY